MGGKLTQTSTVSSGDWIVLYKNDQGDYRGVSFTDLVAAMQAQTGAICTEPDTQYSAPAATGFSIDILGSSASNDVHLIITPFAGYADGEVVLPPVNSCRDKQQILVNCTQAVTALVVDGNGATAVVGAPSALLANDFFKMKFDLATKNWYRVG